MLDISGQLNQWEEEVIRLRRDFHQYPELGYKEFRTSEVVAGYLEESGLEVRRMTRTGVVGLLRGKHPGKTLMLRADMDALAVQEENPVPYRSRNDGIMHACGHDGHTAMLLVAARILAGLKGEIRGNVKFVFEPNEENVGALAMIEAGVLDDPPVNACLGIHLWSLLDSGKIGLTEGPMMAGTDHFELEIKGRGGHTGIPHHAVDPILAAAQVIQSIQMIQTREMDVFQPAIVMVGKIVGGTAGNIIPDHVKLEGTIRHLGDFNASSADNPRRKLERIAEGVCHSHKTEYVLTFPYGHPPVINDPMMTELVWQVALEVLQNKQSIVPYRSMVGEDFSEFAKRVPGVFYFIGAGNSEKNSRFPHHHPCFNIDEAVLRTGVEMHVKTAMKYLEF